MEVISGRIEKAKKVVLYGPEGIGKSSLAAQFPAPIFIDTEGSTTEMTVDRLAKPTSWEMLKQQVDWVKQQDGRFKTLVIDTIDWAEMLCIESVCAKYDKKGIEDFGYGNGYVYTKEEFGRFLNKLQDLIDVAGINVVLTAHTQIRKFEQPDEMGAYDRYELKLGKKTSSQTAPLVKEWADMVLFINYKTMSVAVDDKGNKHKGQGGVRTVYATHSPAWDAKNRQGFPNDFSLDGAYEKYLAPIFDKVPVTVASTTQASTPPQKSPKAQATNLKYTGTKCSTCGEPQFETLSGVSCKNGHGGAASLPEPPKQADPETQQATMDDYNPKLDPVIPQALRDLMLQAKVSEEEIQAVVAQKGYYPLDTPIINYDPGFVNGVLVGAWEQVFGMVEAFRKTIPFN
jgi:hypothetical protein